MVDRQTGTERDRQVWTDREPFQEVLKWRFSIRQQYSRCFNGMFLIRQTLTASWDGLSPNLHLRGPSLSHRNKKMPPRQPPLSPKLTKNVKITKFGFAIFFIGVERNSPLATLNANSSYPVTLQGFCITHPSLQGPFQSPQSKEKCHQNNQIWLSRLFCMFREEQPL